MRSDPETALVICGQDVPHGTVTSTWDLYPVYGFTDVDGSRPDWGAYARETLGMDA